MQNGLQIRVFRIEFTLEMIFSLNFFDEKKILIFDPKGTPLWLGRNFFFTKSRNFS